jgi:ribosome recycling factor
MSEEAKVSIRHIRRDLNEEVKKSEKDKKITEDESKRMQDEIQKLTDSFIKAVDERLTKKEKEVMTV